MQIVLEQPLQKGIRGSLRATPNDLSREVLGEGVAREISIVPAESENVERDFETKLNERLREQGCNTLRRIEAAEGIVEVRPQAAHPDVIQLAVEGSAGLNEPRWRQQSGVECAT